MVYYCLLVYSPMGWIPAASITVTTGVYSYSTPAPRVFLSQWSALPPSDGTHPIPLSSPLSPPSSHYRIGTPTVSLTYTSSTGPTLLLPYFPIWLKCKVSYGTSIQLMINWCWKMWNRIRNFWQDKILWQKISQRTIKRFWLAVHIHFRIMCVK